MRRVLNLDADETSIDMSPLIDMVFILLIFFMVSTTFTKDFKIELERPGSSSGTPASTKSVKIYIDRFSNVFLDSTKIQPWTVQGKLKDKILRERTKSILIVTDEKVDVDNVIQIVDQARLAGISDIGIATEREGR